MRQNRIGIIFFIFILFFILLQIRIVVISLFPDSRLKNIQAAVTVRGSIFDRRDRELAATSTFYSVYMRPKLMDGNYKRNLYAMLSKNYFETNELSGLFSDKTFAWIKRKMPLRESGPVRDLISELKKSNLLQKDELGVITEQGRFYPYYSTAHAVGVVGIDNTGLSGLELSMNNDLAKGYSVNTTIDAEISGIAYEELKKGVIDSKAEFGSVIIIDNSSMEILAMVNYPSYDPNDIKSITSYNLQSRANSSIFEPGSVMKQFSAAFALENKFAAPGYPVYECTGEASVEDHNFTCPTAHGKVDLSTIIQKSCNVGMVQVADRFRKKDFYSFLLKFGFGAPVPLPLLENSSGILRSPEKWSILSKYMISIGQEIGVNALQLSIASAVIADGGVYRTPVLIRSIIDDKGNDIYKPDMKQYPVISPETSSSLLKMMEKVVGENGTAISAQIEGIKIAGKTGTGQIAKEKSAGYYQDLFNAVFVGYVPSVKPKYTFLVVINRPHGDNHTGGLVAAPVFASIMRRIITSTSYFPND